MGLRLQARFGHQGVGRAACARHVHAGPHLLP
jgi:hypothetical protein